MKEKLLLRLSAGLLTIWISGLIGCAPAAPGKIPFNEDSVRAHILPIDEAIVYTKNFRTVRDTFYRRVPPLKPALNLGQAEAFNRDAIAVLLNQTDGSGNPAAGVRVYYGLDKEGQVRMVLVPYDSKGNDIIHELTASRAASIPGISPATAAAGGGQTIENGQRCPVICDNGTSGLNGSNP